MTDLVIPIQLEDLLPTAAEAAAQAATVRLERERRELLENEDSLRFVIGHIEKAVLRGAKSVELPPAWVPACVVGLLQKKGYTVGDNLTHRAVAISW
ncbi:MAG: hypothetical protein Q4C67_06615 [Deinococcus sp.]|nr:hypothetical protein [Deinococcus sp.]